MNCLTGGEHSHSHDDHVDHAHTGHDHKHAHSLNDLSVGLSILGKLQNIRQLLYTQLLATDIYMQGSILVGWSYFFLYICSDVRNFLVQSYHY